MFGGLEDGGLGSADRDQEIESKLAWKKLSLESNPAGSMGSIKRVDAIGEAQNGRLLSTVVSNSSSIILSYHHVEVDSIFTAMRERTTGRETREYGCD